MRYQASAVFVALVHTLLACAVFSADLESDYGVLRVWSQEPAGTEVPFLCHDPWVLASYALAKGDPSVAGALARTGLVGHARDVLQRLRPAPPSFYVALDDARRKRLRNQTGEALSAARAAVDRDEVRRDPVLKAAFAEERGLAARDAGRRDEAAQALVQSARAGYSIGWQALCNRTLAQVVTWQFVDGFGGRTTNRPYEFSPAKRSGVRAVLGDRDVVLVYGESFGELVSVVVTERGSTFVPLGRVEARARLARSRAKAFGTGPCAGPGAGRAAVAQEFPEFVTLSRVVGGRVFVAPHRVMASYPFAAALAPRPVVFLPLGRVNRVSRDLSRELATVEGRGVLVIGEREDQTDLPSADARVATDAERRLVFDDKNGMRVWRAIHVMCKVQGEHLVVGGQPVLPTRFLVPSKRRCDLWVLAGRQTASIEVARAFNSEHWQLPKDGDGRSITIDELGRGARVMRLSARLLRSGAWPPYYVNPFSPRILVHLWDPDAASTRVLMQEFYSRWAAGDDAGTALAKAQGAVRRVDHWREPYYWAGWQLWQYAMDRR